MKLLGNTVTLDFSINTDYKNSDIAVEILEMRSRELARVFVGGDLRKPV